MTEFQAALLLQQMTRLEEQSHRREQNAAYLTEQLKEIPGIVPARCTTAARAMPIISTCFGMINTQFQDVCHGRSSSEALHAEGIPASGGYQPYSTGLEPFLKNTLESRGFQTIYGQERISEYFAKTHRPVNDHLCETAVWLTQTTLLGPVLGYGPDRGGDPEGEEERGQAGESVRFSSFFCALNEAPASPGWSIERTDHF